MSEYHKINSIYKRDEKGRFITGQWTQPEFEYLKDNKWTFDEKVDGTNMRVVYPVFEAVGHDNVDRTIKFEDYAPIEVDSYFSIYTNVSIKGRTDKAQIPTFLLNRMNELFTIEKMQKAFPDIPLDTKSNQQVVLYGEGYGRKIQKVGSLYLPESVDFILFDVRVGHWWLKREDVEVIAERLGIKTTPMIGSGTIQEAVEMTTEGFKSKLGDLTAEGLILRPEVPLNARNGGRIITKIKHKDFKNDPAPKESK